MLKSLIRLTKFQKLITIITFLGLLHLSFISLMLLIILSSTDPILTFALILYPPTLIFCIHLTVIYDFRPPFMWDFPNPELTIFASDEKHIFELIVVYQSHFISKLRLKHHDALTTFLNVTQADIPLGRAFAIA